MAVELVEGSFKYHLLILKFFSLYPFDSCPWVYKPYALFSYIAFTVTTPILADIDLLLSGERDIAVLSQKGFMLMDINAMIVKLIPCKVNPEATGRAMYSLNKKIFNSQLPEQDYILKEAVRNARIILMMFSISCYLAVITWAALPLMYSDRRFPISVWLPYEPFDSTAVYVCTYIFIVLCTVSGGVQNAVLDTLIAGLMYHATCQLRVLKDTVMHLGERADEQVSKEAAFSSPEEKEQLRNKIIYEKICYCIDHYDAIYGFVQELENTFTVVLFTQLLTSIIVIGISLYNLLVTVPFSVPFFTTSSFAVAILTEQFLYCFAGTLVRDESDTLVTAVYMSDWYTYDQKCKKAFLIFMERAKRPMIVTAGKLLDLTLETFATIIRRSYSILAVMKNY